jgi:tetratricopeptide (TPR) repeat protein
MPWAALMAQNAPDVQHRIGALEQQAQKHLQEQKPQLAIPVLNEIVSLDSNNLNAQANLGVLLFFQGGYAEAIPHLRAALQAKPDLWRIQGLLGIAEKRSGDSQAALGDLERAFPNLDDRKFQVEVGLELIEIYSASAQMEKALSLGMKLRELAPENPQILFVTYHISRRVTDQSVVGMMLLGPDSAEMHMIMASELARQGEQANSIAQYREAIRLNPKLPGAHFELAEQLRSATDPGLNGQAEAEYRAAIQVNPYDEKSWVRLGGILADQGRLDAAKEYYTKALALQPKDSDAKTGLAIVLSSLNQTSEAISVLESALQDDPTNIEAHYRLSMLYRRAGRTADAQRETDAFRQYQELKEKLETVFKQLGGAVREK